MVYAVQISILYLVIGYFGLPTWKIACPKPPLIPMATISLVTSRSLIMLICLFCPTHDETGAILIFFLFLWTSMACFVQVGHGIDHFTCFEGIPGVPETNFNNRPNSFKVLSPARTCVVCTNYLKFVF